jgi:hypothetical protein
MLAVTGITNKSLRALMTGLLGGTPFKQRHRADHDPEEEQAAGHPMSLLELQHTPLRRYCQHR